MTARRSALPDPDLAAPPSIGSATKTAAWGLVFWATVQTAGALFQQNATARVAVQAALAEWGAGRMGIAWSDRRAPDGARRTPARLGLGALLGGVAAALVVMLALATKVAVRQPGAPAVGALVIGLLIAGLAAVRDELLLRGVVLGATRGLLPGWAALASCGAAAAAARFGAFGAESGPVLAVEALRGVALASLWMRDRGAWMACAANACWTWALDSVVRGGLISVRFVVEPNASVPALAVLSLAASGASAWALRSRMEMERPAGLR
jgi:hypothetical protein